MKNVVIAAALKPLVNKKISELAREYNVPQDKAERFNDSIGKVTGKKDPTLAELIEDMHMLLSMIRQQSDKSREIVRNGSNNDESSLVELSQDELFELWSSG